MKCKKNHGFDDNIGWGGVIHEFGHNSLLMFKGTWHEKVITW
jgi:hypothetical protein